MHIIPDWKPFLILIVVLLLHLPLPAQAKIKDLCVGVNHSKVDAAGFSQPVGFMLGKGTEWQLHKSFSLESEMNIVYRQTKMLNKIGISYPGYVGRYDLWVQQVFVQFPVLIKLVVPGTQSKFKCYAGPTMMLAFHDDVEINGDEEIFDPYEFGSNPYYQGKVDVVFGEDPGWVTPVFDSSTWGFSLGVEYKVNSLIIGTRYTKSTLRNPNAITFNMPLHTLTLIVGI